MSTPMPVTGEVWMMVGTRTSGVINLEESSAVTVPVALQVDHGHSVASAKAAMEAGLTSVMIDASHDPFDENVRITRRVLELARARGVSVEAEIGYVKGNEPGAGSQIGRVPVPATARRTPPSTNRR